MKLQLPDSCACASGKLPTIHARGSWLTGALHPPPPSPACKVARTLAACPDALLDDGLLDATIFLGTITEQARCLAACSGCLLWLDC
jgi:hypothetical protein